MARYNKQTVRGYGKYPLFNFLSTWAKRHQLVLFFGLANTVSWAIWAPLVIQHPLPTSNLSYLHLAGDAGPMVSALVLTAVVTGKVGTREIVRRMVKWDFGIMWYLFAILGPLVLFVVSTFIASAFGEPLDLNSLGRTAEFPDAPLAFYYLGTLLFYGWGEEVGWRGFALPRLQRNRNTLVATFILSIFWALWHLPLFWSVPGYIGLNFLEIIMWYSRILAGSVVVTWLYNSTRGSILIAALFHASVSVAFKSPQGETTMIILHILLAIWALISVIIGGTADISRAGKYTISSSGRSSLQDIKGCDS